ncbi:MAG TPA: MauE/DoxX family redox-associated membrane protein [Solirubrobacteraceae bacterium]|nr:MauE/DoxX family redox-associated membrane protein [Solirubrobacteraceae bacterium]
MNSIVIVARALLVVVFGVAGLAKLADAQGTSDTVEAFGIPKRLARPAAQALPVAELIVAVALIPQPTARWAGIGAALLLIVFSGGVSYALSQGRTPDCNCFGQVSSEQISWRTLARNAVLIAIAVFVAAAGPGSSFSSWTSNLSAANLVAGLALLAAALFAVLAFGYRRQARASDGSAQWEQVEGALAPGAEAPYFELPDLEGVLVSRDTLLERGLPIVLIFASPACRPCYEFLPELSRWNGAISESVTLVVIESGVADQAAVADQINRAGGVRTLVESDQATAQAYFAPGTPTGIAISPEGLVASPPLPGQQHIENLIRSVLQTGGAVPRAGAAPVPASA